MSSYEWIPARSLGTPNLTKREPNYDTEVSEKVGVNVLATDSRLLKWVVEKKRNNGNSDLESVRMDRLLENPENIKELKAIFNPN